MGVKELQRWTLGKSFRLVLLCSFLLILSRLILSAQTPPKPSAATRYKIIELPLKPLHLTDSGEVVGIVAGQRAAVWSPQHSLRLLDLPEGTTDSEARSANRRGYIAGFAHSRDYSTSKAFIDDNSKLVVLPGDRAKAFAINDSGDAVGESGVMGKIPTAPVLWKGSTVTDLGTCCGGTAVGINNAGQVIGSMYDRQGRYRAFLWDATHGLQYIGPEDSNSAAIAINRQGHVLLQQFEKGVVLYKGESKTIEDRMIRLTSPNGAIDPRGMNNADTVVGGYGSFSDASKAFVWDEKRGLRNLNELLPAHSDWELESAAAINDAGQIVGVGDYKGKEDVGFMLIEEKSPQASH